VREACTCFIAFYYYLGVIIGGDRVSDRFIGYSLLLYRIIGVSMSGEADECSSDETGTGDIFINPFTYYLPACFPSISFCPFCYYCIKPAY